MSLFGLVIGMMVCQLPNMRYFVVVDCSVVNVREGTVVRFANAFEVVDVVASC